MQLKRYTDYALRVLLYLGAHPDEVVSVSRIAAAFDVSRNHLLKVANGLVSEGLVTSFRGNRGGLRLAVPPAAINIGEVVRRMEGARPVIDCGEPPCPILVACRLKNALGGAQQAFIDHLARYTLADLIDGTQQQLVRLLKSA